MSLLETLYPNCNRHETHCCFPLALSLWKTGCHTERALKHRWRGHTVRTQSLQLQLCTNHSEGGEALTALRGDEKSEPQARATPGPLRTVLSCDLQASHAQQQTRSPVPSSLFGARAAKGWGLEGLFRLHLLRLPTVSLQFPKIGGPKILVVNCSC